MRKKQLNWVLVAILSCLALVVVSHSVLPPTTSARHQRIQAVNQMPGVTMILPGTNTLPATNASAQAHP
ncbi:exported hypothetical protein [Verrucomicrobia bacterium]|nr:exported hypothetical protein [Verrucomicrobiota bacterium]